MPTAQQDTEITLGTGRMLAIFFALVLVCAFFFAMGFSLGRKTAMAGIGTVLNASTVAPASVVRPSAAKNDAAQTAAQNDFGFYKAVGQKSADAALTPQDAKAPAPASTAAQSPAQASAKEASDAASAAATTATNAYYVQVAAVSRQEDAESLVEALKKKQYPAFTANSAAADKFFHVQVGPYADLKDAEAMRGRLISDGYNPIVKK
jgi:DedD protein